MMRFRREKHMEMHTVYQLVSQGRRHGTSLESIKAQDLFQIYHCYSQPQYHDFQSFFRRHYSQFTHSIR